jgi:hypothetical protein
MNSKKIVITPLLVLLYFFIHYLCDLYYFVDAHTVLLQVVKYIVVTGCLFFAGYRVFKSKERYTFAFTALLFVFLFFGSIADTGVAAHFFKPAAAVDLTMISIFFFVCAAIIMAAAWLNGEVVKKTLRFWWIYCLVLMLYDAGSTLVSTRTEKKYLSAKNANAILPKDKKTTVFFLLFDMYPSDTVLKKYLQYDNSALASFLKDKHFFVTGNGRSLYTETYYSLSSTLTLRPLEYFNDSAVPDYKKKLIALKNIEHAVLPALFKQSGYAVRNYSVFNLQGQSSPLQFNLNYHLENALTSSTFFNRWYDGFEPDFLMANRNIDLGAIKKSWSSNIKADTRWLDEKFNALMDTITRQRVPSFNYFHFMMPHPPVLYDSSGIPFSVRDMYAYNGFDKTNRNFTAYIQYANGVLRRMVSEIFSKMGSNVVIIVQGDHGYREFSDRFPEEMRYGILNAVYLPGQNYDGFTDSITPIKTFTHILSNQYHFMLQRK